MSRMLNQLSHRGSPHSSFLRAPSPPLPVFPPCACHPHPASSPSQATEDQMRLLRLQRRLEDELGGRFLDLSLHDTVTTLILGGHNKRAEQLARDFRIPDKRWVRAAGCRWVLGPPAHPAIPSSPASPQALVAEADCPGRSGRLGGAREVFKEQEITHWLPGETRAVPVPHLQAG